MSERMTAKDILVEEVGNTHRFVVPRGSTSLGDDFQLGVRADHVQFLLDGLNKVKELQPSAKMIAEVDKMIQELQAQDGIVRLLRISRTVQHLHPRGKCASGKHKVVACNAIRILAFLGATFLSDELRYLFVDQGEALRKSGITLNVEVDGDKCHLSIFDECLDFVFYPVN